MDTLTIRNHLMEAMRNFEVIDCHEHLGPEKCRLEINADVFMLFAHYTRATLILAGLPRNTLTLK